MQYMWYGTTAIAAGYILDLILGDPYWLFHPIRLIGSLISWLEKRLLRENLTNRQKYMRGMFMTCFVVFSSMLLPAVLLIVSYQIHVLIGLAVETVMCYQILAVKCLKVESMKVYKALKMENLEQARNAVAMIVGRDTQCLDENGIIRAAVETVAENTSDGVIAPLFYLFFLGPVGGFAYKAINTMDSMVGYKNEQYLYFGRFAAKADDVVNFFPSRLGAYLMIAACALVQIFGKEGRPFYNAKNAYRIYKRDRRKHSSPNSAQTESVCAGALQVALSGDNYYFGKLVKKPVIGDAIRPLETEDIKRSNVLLYLTAFLMVLLVTGLRFAVAAFCGTVL